MRNTKRLIVGLAIFILSCDKKEDLALLMAANPANFNCDEYEIVCEQTDYSPFNDMMRVLQSNSYQSYELMLRFWNHCHLHEKSQTYSTLQNVNLVQYWLGGDVESFERQLNGIATVVHESYHTVSSAPDDPAMDCNEVFQAEKYWYLRDEPIKVKSTEKVLPVTAIATDVLARFRGALRYEIYIKEGNAGDIFGLLNEFAAYYFGNKAAFDVWPEYKKRYLGSKDSDYIDAWYEQIIGSLEAYYEFKYYIAVYMANIKRHHKTFYKEMESNKEFWMVFNLVDQKYSNLIKEYESFLIAEILLNDYKEDKVSIHNQAYLDALNKLDWKP